MSERRCSLSGAAMLLGLLVPASAFVSQSPVQKVQIKPRIAPPPANIPGAWRSASLQRLHPAHSAPLAAQFSMVGMVGAAFLLGTTVAVAQHHSAARGPTTRRLRLAGREIPRNKEIAWALACAVYGIGKTTAFKILKDTGINPHKKTYELSEEEELSLAEELTKYTLENPLRRMYKANCQLLLEIKHRRGIRMEKGLPVRFQRSKTNANICRKLNPGRV